MSRRTAHAVPASWPVFLGMALLILMSFSGLFIECLQARGGTPAHRDVKPANMQGAR